MSELRRRMMVQQGGGGFIQGTKYAYMDSTDTTLVADPDYCLSPYIPITEHSNILIYLGGLGGNNGILREFVDDTCVDYWGDRGGIRNLTLNSNTNYIRLCLRNDLIYNSFVLYGHPTNPLLAYYIYRGEDVENLIVNNVCKYYLVNGGDFNSYILSPDYSCILSPLLLDPTVPNFNTIGFYTGGANNNTTLFEYDANGAYLDYWGSRDTERVVTLNSNARYIHFSMPRNTAQTAYAKYNSTGQYIWKGNDVT